MMSETILGIIGGSGLYDIPCLVDTCWEPVSSPFGAPSDSLLIGRLDGQKVVFLPRHGRAHTVAPGTINYLANMDAMKRVGVTDLVSLSACGSLREDITPGSFVRIDQYVDRTSGRSSSFFGNGLVAHVSMAEPVCGRLNDWIDGAAETVGIKLHQGCVYIAVNGPQFSTKAESHLYRSWGCDVVGMTNMPEARLAREAEICYASIAMVTDYDCWHEGHDYVQVNDIIAVMNQNAAQAAALVGVLAGTIENNRNACAHGCDRVLDKAIITSPEHRDPAMVEKLQAVAGRVLGAGDG